MQWPNLERWQELCRQAATEQDPKKLMEPAETNRLLQKKENRLREQAQTKERKRFVVGSLDEPTRNATAMR
jgi:hypothetical protein